MRSDDGTPWLPERLFEGKTAFVTGGGTGLGLAVARRLGGLGANVVCASRDVGHHDDAARGRPGRTASRC